MNDIQTEDFYDPGIIKKRPVSIVKGKGALLWDSEGKKYLDFGASYGTANVGHCNDNVVKAIESQAPELIHVYSNFYNSVRAKLMKKLASLFSEKLNKVYLCNSGAESVEAALKFARAATGKKKIIACMRAFHGRTFGSVSATHNPDYREAFKPLVPEFTHVPFNNIEKLKETINDDTAAFIVEPIQGEAGFILPDENYLKNVQKICREKNILLIVDEIQTGFGRTGKMFGFEHYGIEPDIVCVSKSLGGGYPIGATITTEKITGKVPKKSHSSTFGGNPLGSAAALAAVEFMLEKNLPEQAQKKGEYFLKKLKQINSSKIRQVRGKGLMVAVELKERAGPYISALMEKGILVIPSGKTVIRFLPPLIITEKQIDEAVEKLEKVLK